jgi:hypothetical protein
MTAGKPTMAFGWGVDAFDPGGLKMGVNWATRVFGKRDRNGPASSCGGFRRGTSARALRPFKWRNTVYFAAVPRQYGRGIAERLRRALPEEVDENGNLQPGQQHEAGSPSASGRIGGQVEITPGSTACLRDCRCAIGALRTLNFSFLCLPLIRRRDPSVQAELPTPARPTVGTAAC